MMKNILLGMSAFLVLGLVVAFANAAVGFQQDDCPGKIVCPLSGQQVCTDQCPMNDPSRDDCPGKIECPIDGTLVCRDRCPLANSEATEQTEGNSCCSQ